MVLEHVFQEGQKVQIFLSGGVLSGTFLAEGEMVIRLKDHVGRPAVILKSAVQALVVDA